MKSAIYLSELEYTFTLKSRWNFAQRNTLVLDRSIYTQPFGVASVILV